jgi:hypothetical protein
MQKGTDGIQKLIEYVPEKRRILLIQRKKKPW